MRTPRRIAVVVAWLGVATSVYLAIASDLPQVVIVLVFFASFVPYVLWLRVEPYFERPRIVPTTSNAGSVETGPDAGPLLCAHCGRPITADPGFSLHVLEGMHGLCFHLEYEHPGDPDLPCSDTGCFQWALQLYQAKLRELGVDPGDVIGEAVEARFR
jgi:hypothetical protein